MNDRFALYESGLTDLLERLGKEHQRYSEALTLQARLLENLAETRQYGSSQTRRTERAEILDSLNQLALATLEASFNELCVRTSLADLGEQKPANETPGLGLVLTTRSIEVYEDLERLLYASGLQLVERRSDDLILESLDMLGVRIVVRFEASPSEKVGSDKVLSFYHTVEELRAHIGCLISYGGYTEDARRVPGNLQRPELLRLFTHEEFVRHWIDFRPYLDHLSRTWTKTQASRYYMEIHLDHNGVKAPLSRLISHLTADREATAIAILGDWGTGKSVFCQSLAFEIAKLYAAGQTGSRMPILLNLGELLDDTNTLSAAVREMTAVGISMNHELLAELARQGRLVWILDGLDEIGTQLDRLEFRKVIQNIHKLVELGDNKVVMTSTSSSCT